MSSDTGFWPTILRHVRSGHLRAAGTEMLVGAIMLLIAGMTLQGANISELRAINARVERSNGALLQVAEADNMAVGVEMSARGWALTGNPVFQRYYRQNVWALHTAVNRLAAFVSDQPAQVRIIAKLRPLVERQIAIYGRLSELPPARAGEVAAAIVDPTIRQNRYSLLRTLYDIRDAQLKLVADRQRESERKVQQTYILSVGIVAFAFLLAALGLVLVRGGPPS
jgi:CHASE3 domain sensor protein